MTPFVETPGGLVHQLAPGSDSFAVCGARLTDGRRLKAPRKLGRCGVCFRLRRVG